ncbi:MAG: c-type cytochrome, partial [Verrucomicrobia bacterium]|nr:c-type cytochrome [Verrucomicrobiota bacterium]
RALEPVLGEILRTAPDAVRVAAARTAGQIGLKEGAPALLELVSNRQVAARVRIAGLHTLVTLKADQAVEAVKLALADGDADVREAATELQADVPHGEDTVSHLATTLDTGTIGERQAALAALGSMTSAAADELLGQWLDKLRVGQVPKEMQLDVIEAAEKRATPALKEKLEKYQAQQPKSDDLTGYRDLLYGGNPAAGRTVFFDRPEASCVRCHKIKGQGGDVGPDLSTVGSRQTRDYILESILYPNKQIASGFENVIVTMQDGTSYAGVVKADTANELVINSPEDGVLHLKKSQIQSREKGLSAMPEGMANILSKDDLRNLVAFLSGLK